MTARVAIIGYAALEHVAFLDRPAQAGRTSTMLGRRADSWPRLGGSPSYVAAALARAGINAAPLTWIGDDPEGSAYAGKLAREGISTAGLAIVAAAATPVAIMTYDPDGGCVCLFDPGVPDAVSLNADQTEVLRRAEWLITPSRPARAPRAAPSDLGDKQRLMWVVKEDPRAVPPDLARALAARADVICHSKAEAGFVAAARVKAGRQGQIVIATAAAEGATITTPAGSLTVKAAALVVVDPTGAGDSFAGGVLAALVLGETDPASIVQSGHRAAHHLLAARIATMNGDGK